MEKRKIVFASANPGKIREASEILGDGFEILSAAEAGVTEDIPETGNTLRDNSHPWRRPGSPYCKIRRGGERFQCKYIKTPLRDGTCRKGRSHPNE